MKRTKPQLRHAAVAALATAACYASLPAVAAAPGPNADELQEIVVTGSILRRTDAETPSPVSVLTAEDLELRGINTVAEGLQRLSANGAGAMTQGWNNGSNFANGANAVSLRGLTVQSTLTIFDGLRMAPYPLADDGHRNFVDLNTVPDAVLDRIEVLRDGASSTYGADAIAGVVNVITKKEFTGLRLNASGLGTIKGGTERRADVLWGKGSLKDDGYNFYGALEYQNTDPIWARDRSYPFNSSDKTGVCDEAGNCLGNFSAFGANSNGTMSGSTITTIPLVAPGGGTTGTSRVGAYQLLNASAGCNLLPGLTPVTLTATQNPSVAGTLYTGPAWASSQCSQDPRKQFSILTPGVTRSGAFAKFTAKVGSHSEFYMTGNFYDVVSNAPRAPTGFQSQTTAPRTVAMSPVVLPVYVCAAGVATFGTTTGAPTFSGCSTTAAAGTPQFAVLNPNNPFASNGQTALLRSLYDRPTNYQSDARSMRGVAGLSGEVGDGWRYNADLTFAQIKLKQTYKNYLIPQRVANVIATGAYNFVNPSLNSEAIRNYIAPDKINNSISRVGQGQAFLSKDVLTLPGGPLQAAVGLAFRKESISNPSANPDNITAPFTRYVSINAVGAVGAREVSSGSFEISAPFLKGLETNLSGRYDKYNTGQKNFSPKFGVKYKAMEDLLVRGTYSKGFRIPSFNEAYGLPFAGFVSATVNCTTYAAWCASHGNNTYATSAYSLGKVGTGNPALNPEKSRSFTLGAVWEPKDNFNMTLDYWNVRINDLVGSVSAAEQTAALDEYYRNNGVVTTPGITVTPAIADPAYPTALPIAQYLNYSYKNANSEQVSGLDFGLNYSRGLWNGIKWTSSLDASYLLSFKLLQADGTTEEYAGSMSPCDWTSCSGAPKLRGSWQNTFAWDKLSVTGTWYYTSSMDEAEVDLGGTYGDCVNNSLNGAGAPVYVGTSIPSKCRSPQVVNFDLNARYKATDKVTVYVDVMNALGIQAPVDPGSAYGNGTGMYYNPAWATSNMIGRSVRVGINATLY